VHAAPKRPDAGFFEGTPLNAVESTIFVTPMCRALPVLLTVALCSQCAASDWVYFSGKITELKLDFGHFQLSRSSGMDPEVRLVGDVGEGLVERHGGDAERA
jgi:hypothetical protein